jgi:thiol-disulfide isomerase/thioredoxin
VSAAPSDSLLLACLCAAWCRTCTDYQPVFDAVAAEFGAARVLPLWVDIEDDEDALGEVDVVDFPTLLIAHGETISFFGPVLPHAQTLRGLLERALAAGLGELQRADLAGLAGRLRALAGER